MDKQSLIRDMKQTFGGAGLLTPTQISAYMGLKWEATNKFLKDLEFAKPDDDGRKKLYFVGDIAQRIMDNRTAN